MVCSDSAGGASGARRPASPPSPVQPERAAHRSAVTATQARAEPVQVIGRMLARYRLDAGPSPASPFQTVRAVFPHTAYRWSSWPHLRGPRIANRPEQPIQALDPKPLGRPAIDSTGVQVAPDAPNKEASQAALHAPVDVLKLDGSVPGAEVLTPAAQHGVQMADEHPHIPDPVPPPVRELFHS